MNMTMIVIRATLLGIAVQQLVFGMLSGDLTAFVILITLGVMVYHFRAVKKANDAQAHQETMKRMPGLTYGDIIYREYHLGGKLHKSSTCERCVGCGHPLRHLIGHPVFDETCTNTDCGANHVERGNEYAARRETAR